jgi:thioredoxin 1
MTDDIISVGGDTWDQEILRSKEPVVVYFWAPWCGHCKAFAPVFEEVGKQFSGRIKMAKLNCDENGTLATQCGIMGTPTMAFFRDGKEVDRVVGALPSAELKTKIEKFLSSGSRKK